MALVRTLHTSGRVEAVTQKGAESSIKKGAEPRSMNLHDRARWMALFLVLTPLLGSSPKAA
jgi:hypothetical protein